MSELKKTIKLGNEEKEMFNNTIIESIKIIAEQSEGAKHNNCSTITELCHLFQKLNN